MPKNYISNPQVIEALTRIAADNAGILRPETVVESARDEDSPLHDHFEWDDAEAAAAYRVRQARDMIRICVSYIDVSPDEKMPVRVFVSLTPDREEDGRGYRVTAQVMSDTDLRRQLLADAKREMLSFKAKYQQLTELAEVFTAITKIAEDETVLP